MRKLAVGLATLVVVLAALTGLWLTTPMGLRGSATKAVDLAIEPGTSVREITVQVSSLGVQTEPQLLYWWFRLSGKDRQIKAGSYELSAATTPWSLLNTLVRGDESLRTVTIVEGWNLRQVRDALARADQLKPQTQGLNNAALMQALGLEGESLEGRLFPDTYSYAKGSSDLAVMARAVKAMDAKLDAVWAQRDPRGVLQSPHQALILASIVEKESAQASDRALISAVFHNRLRLGMRLQTDPTVIYGMGERFDGNLRKADLRADTPWNTYTRHGLPPTPIAMPGKAALLAAVRPADAPVLYFVAKGDGGSWFSQSLEEHNRAVNKYQRGQ